MPYVNIKKWHSNLYIALALSLFVFPIQSKAGLPGVDASGLSARIMDNVEEQAQAQGRQMLIDQISILDQVIGENDMDNDNNTQANNIVRRSKENQEIQNKSILERMNPMNGVCASVGIDLGLEDVFCTQQSALSNDDEDQDINDVLDTEDRERANIIKADLVSGIIDTNPLFEPENYNDNQSGDEENQQGSTNTNQGSQPDNGNTSGSGENATVVSRTQNALNAEPMISSRNTNISPEEYDSMIKMIDLIAHNPAYNDGYLNQRPMKDFDNEDRMIHMREQSHYQIARKGLMYPLTMRTPKGTLLAHDAIQDDGGEIEGSVQSGEMTYLMNYQQYVDNNMNVDAIQRISTGDSSTPTKLYRSIVLSKAKQLAMSLDQLRYGLRMENNLAVNLSRKITDSEEIGDE